MTEKEKSPKEKLMDILEQELAQGKSLTQISKQAQVSYDRLHNFHSGRREVLDIDLAQKILRGLGKELILK